MKEIKLTQGKFAIVDDCDYAYVSKFRWHARRDTRKQGDVWYAARNVKTATKTTIGLMHRELLGVEPGLMVDHVDGDGLNNRRENIRTCTVKQNNCNQRKRDGSSLFKGVSLIRSSGKWRASIKIDGASRNLGNYPTEREAAAAYDATAASAFGNFARLNLP
jgi:hypothetical protein